MHHPPAHAILACALALLAACSSASAGGGAEEGTLLVGADNLTLYAYRTN